MLDLKPYGAFIENTIRPMLEEFKWILEECEKKNISITEKNVRRILEYIATTHITVTIFKTIQTIIIAVIISITCYLILND